tara:strand:+ start:294 stop:521 length:228 start_codon:yes stop_codon:yes gene_type:complete
MSDWSEDIYDAYNNKIDDCNPMVRIDNCIFMPSEVLRKVDPIAYDCGLKDWLDSLAQDGLFCLECEKSECSCEEE